MGARLAILLVLICAAGLTVPAAAQAPASPAAVRGADVAYEAARQAFEALSEAERRAIQDALLWTGDYRGLVDGGFGRGTRTAMQSYARRLGLPEDGALDARAGLLASAASAKAAVGFEPVRDPRSGAALGLPLKILTRRTDTQTGSRWLAADGAVAVETWMVQESAVNLTALYDTMKDTNATRRVTYKLLRPDFFVVTADLGKSDQYTRFARGVVDGAPVLRGYAVVYPKGLENVALAIVNGFEPFPVPVPAATVAPPVQSAPRSASPPAPARIALRATAVVVGTDMAASVIGACATPRIGGKVARLIKRDEATGLALFEARGLGLGPIASALAAPEQAGPALVVFEASSGAATAPVVASGQIMPGASPAAPMRLLAPLEANAAGAPAFNRRGEWVGFVGLATAPMRIAGVVPQTTWPLVPAQALAALLAPATPSAPIFDEARASDMAARIAPSLAPLTCD